MSLENVLVGHGTAVFDALENEIISLHMDREEQLVKGRGVMADYAGAR